MALLHCSLWPLAARLGSILAASLAKSRPVKLEYIKSGMLGLLRQHMCLGDTSVQPAARVAVAALAKDVFEHGDVAPAGLTTEEWRTLPPKDVDVDEAEKGANGSALAPAPASAGAVGVMGPASDADPADAHGLPLLLDHHDMTVFADGFPSHPTALVEAFDQVRSDQRIDGSTDRRIDGSTDRRIDVIFDPSPSHRQRAPRQHFASPAPPCQPPPPSTITSPPVTPPHHYRTKPTSLF